MQKPTQLGDFNDLVHSTINVLEDRVAALENRIKALEPNKSIGGKKIAAPLEIESKELSSK